jgi:hypothetical protein
MKQWLWEVRNGWRLRPRYRGCRGWEALWAWAAYRLPRRLVYWVLIRAGVTHIHDDEEVPEVPFTEILRRAY